MGTTHQEIKVLHLVVPLPTVVGKPPLILEQVAHGAECTGHRTEDITPTLLLRLRIDFLDTRPQCRGDDCHDIEHQFLLQFLHEILLVDATA